MTLSTPEATATREALAPGALVAERYRVLKPLGEGGMGAVYLAEHVHMRKTVALKVLHAEVCSSKEIVLRFEREAIAAGHIGHPNVAAATDFGRLESGAFFLVLEFVPGQTLRAALDGGALAPARAEHITRGILAGLRAAHAKGIVHRDLKPENVILAEREGEADFVKILDFGIAKVELFQAAGPESGVVPLTRMGALMGTPDYMSPEQALGQAVDLRTDLYALGVMLFEMLTGACPFRGGAMTLLRDRILYDAPALPDDVAARIEPRLREVVRCLLARTADARFQSADEVLAALDGAALPAPPPSSAAPGGVPVSVRPITGIASPAARAPTVAVDAVTGSPAASPLAALQGRPLLLAMVAASAAGVLILLVVVVVAAGRGTAPKRLEYLPFTPAGEVQARHAAGPAEGSAAPPPPALPAPPPATSASGAAGGGRRGFHIRGLF